MTILQRRFEGLRLLWNLARGRMLAHLWTMRGARVGSKTAIGRRCVVDRPWCVQLGERVVLEADVYVKMVADTASIQLGDSVFVGRGVQFDILGDVKIGAHTVIAPNCFVTDHNHGSLRRLRIDQQSCAMAPVSIGSDVWLGVCVVVLPGVRIGEGVIVGANSVVTRDVAPMTVVAGTPARFLRMRTGDGTGDGGR